MSAYRTADNPDRVKAAFAVVLVHVVLAFVILTGLNVKMVAQQVERLKTFDITEDAPPPPEPFPPPTPDDSSAPKDEAAPANIKSKPTPVEAPTPPVPLPLEQKITSSQVRGPEGADRTAGAANTPGAGTGAGGQGSGFGGGAGTGRGYTPARIIRKIPDSQYRRISAGRLPRGSATATFRVNTNGRASGCRIVRSSSDPQVDAIVCEAITGFMRFSPARDPGGGPVAQDMTYTATWDPNY